MTPTYSDGSLVAACTWAYLQSTPERGDVVVFWPPNSRNAPYLKRVIGLAGDEIAFKDGNFFLNGLLQNEPYTNPEGRLEEELETIVPEAHVFVAGDNRSRSYDSRHFGPIPVSDVIGKICGRF